MGEHYLLISILIALLALIPFFVKFERRKVQARELVLLAVLIATAVVGRAAFFMLPNFKPILAIVIIAGVALGGESGFMVGAMAAFVSNFIFGQGPWTPFQMVAMGLVGFLAGILFKKYYAKADSFIGKRKLPLLIFGAVAVFFLYGGIVDIWTILAMTPHPTLATVVAVYGAAVYFNLVHAGATVIFLLLLAGPMLKKLRRVQIKYGIDNM
ncbi:MAG: ECF transporter S component [Bacillota bacterium]|nr:ECF transporter S component [Bacillota bacterium]